MKRFYKNQAKIVIMMILTLFTQITGPVAGYIYADGTEGSNFQVVKTTIEESNAAVDWVLTLSPEDTARAYNDKLDFVLKKEVSGELVADDENQTKIGNYTINEEGELLLEIDQGLYEAFKQEDESLERDDYTSGSAIEGSAQNTIAFTGRFVVNGVKSENRMKPMSGLSIDPVSFNQVVLEHVDLDGNLISGDFKVGFFVKIKFSYEIEDYIEVDTSKVYEFTIPSEITIINELNLPLKDTNGRTLANISVKTDGTMTVQFLAEINNEEFNEERTGWITIGSQFGNVEIGDGGNTTITFEVNGVSKEVTVKFEEVKEKKVVVLEKTGSYDGSNNIITWAITVKPTTEPKNKTIPNVRIKDTIQAGQTYIAGSAMLNGTTINPDPVSGTLLDYTFENPLMDGQVYAITFKTKADLSKFKTQGETLTFKNTVSGTYDVNNTPTKDATATVTTKVDFIKKTGAEVAGAGKINWKIEVNNNNLELPAGIQIEDTVGIGLAFNNDLLIDGNPITDYGTLDVVGQKFTFTFTNPISAKHTLTYSTTVTDSGAYDSNDKQTYKNQVRIIWNGITGGSASTPEIGVGVSTSVIKKSGAGYNVATHVVTWKIVVNANKIKITNPILTDALPATLEYVSHTVTGNKTWDFANNTGNLTFSHTGEINETYTITLVTKIKDEYKDYFGSNGTKTIYNTAKLAGTGVKPSETEGRQDIVSKVIEKSATAYDYTTRKASWKIVVNQNKMPITNAVITDVIESDFHQFVAGSLKIDGVATSAYTVNGNTISITLGNITGQKVITFETQIPANKLDEFFKENGGKELKNNATLTGVEIKDGGVNSQATQPVQNTVVSKKGKYTNGNDFIDWEVIINSNRLIMNNVALEDTLQEGLILDTASVKVNRLNANSDGTYAEGLAMGIDTNYNPLTNAAIFDVGDISDAYMLRFRTDVNDGANNRTFNNTITLKGSNGKQDGVSTAIGVKFQTGDAGASGTSTRGSLTVVKVDKENLNDIIYLQGAKFQLLQNGVAKYTSDETDGDGNVFIDEIKMGKYDLKEIQAPEGYRLDEVLKQVEFKKGVDTKYVTYEFENKKIKGNVEFIKRDNEENPLPGAEFSLYYATDEALGDAVGRVRSDENGLVRFENIPYGDYLVKETIAPIGYEPSGVTQTVEIRENEQTMILRDVVNKKIIGDLEIIKISGDGEETQDGVAPIGPRMLEYGKTLAGAEFELKNEHNVYTGATDENGRIVFKDIDYGIYILTETKAPRGYILNETTYEVKISEYNQEIIRIVVENQKIKGYLEILKIDSRTGRPLKNATFTLYDNNMNKIEEITTGIDGKAAFDNLEYGKYFYEETRAPGGYYSDRTVYALDIPGNETLELEDGFIINKIIENRRRPDDPEEPTTPIRPIDPTDPQELPRYEVVDVPGPNNPTSPDEFILIDEDGVPLGTYEKQEDPNGTHVYIVEDSIPLGGPGVPQTGSSLVPKTGDHTPVLLLLILFVVSLFSGIGLLVFKRKRFN